MKKKVILITGASSGMGHETAKKLLEQGHVVYAAARRVEKMKRLGRNWRQSHCYRCYKT